MALSYDRTLAMLAQNAGDNFILRVPDEGMPYLLETRTGTISGTCEIATFEALQSNGKIRPLDASGLWGYAAPVFTVQAAQAAQPVPPASSVEAAAMCEALAQIARTARLNANETDNDALRLYRIIDALDPDADVDPRISAAYQLLITAAISLRDARMNLMRCLPNVDLENTAPFQKGKY